MTPYAKVREIADPTPQFFVDRRGASTLDGPYETREAAERAAAEANQAESIKEAAAELFAAAEAIMLRKWYDEASKHACVSHAEIERLRVAVDKAKGGSGDLPLGQLPRK